MNIKLAKKIIANLNHSGVTEFVVCPGGRNAPLVKVLAAAEGVRVHYFYDERAAGFFALGRGRRNGNPVAVVTTSGTAAAELLPAAIEAHYSGFSLVLVTADRPPTYRGSGAPQTIEQVGLFSHYTQPTLDVATVEDVPAKFSLQKSLHINLCFSEPLLDQKISQLELKAQVATAPESERQSAAGDEHVAHFLKGLKRPLVILGALRASVRGRMLEFLSALNAPIFAEAQSGLRECKQILPLILKAGEGALTADFVGREFDGILRVGSVPTLRLWRDLDLSLAKLPVLSVGDTEFSGLARESRPAATFTDLFTAAAHFESRHELLAVDAKKFGDLERLLLKHPTAETSFFRRLSENIAEDDLVFVGNSLPIREWDFAADYNHPHPTVLANRGANGIDGLIATFMGLAEQKRSNWIILGDLSALYDLNALSFAEPNVRLRIVVVNNRGGHIFTNMFGDKNFLNQHNLNFSKWAEMFGFDYLQSDLVTHLGKLADRVVIEINPDNDESQKFWADYRGVQSKVKK